MESTKPLLLKARIQRHLALAYLAEDDGEFAFVLCRRGLEKAIGKRLKGGQKVMLKVSIELLDEGVDTTEEVR